VIAQSGHDALGLGGFWLGDMELALPMTSLREVVPLAALTPLPCSAPSVIGGIDLRGVVIPVLSLRILLGKDSPPREYPCVIIMVHSGRLLGLLADGITGIFNIEPAQLHEVSLADVAAREAVFRGSVRREDTQSLVSVLSPDVLASLPQVPMVADPEPERQHLQDFSDEVVIQDDSLPLMLLRCGRVPLVIDAMVAHATLSDPQVQRSVLAMGHCRGVMEHGGLMIPAIDLQSLCGLGELDRESTLQAFIVSLPEGMVAFLVNEVVDVVRAQPQDIIAVPKFALPHPTLFGGGLPTTALPDEVVGRTGIKSGQYLLIDASALRAHAEVVALARSNTQAGQPVVHAAHGQSGPSADASMRRSMITYALGRETATPLEQIHEILAFSRDILIFESAGALLGFMVHQGRSIPVHCLSRLTGGAPPEITPAASVLVVESEGEYIGFAVPQLKVIEPADWEPELPDMGSGGYGGKGRKLAKLGSGVSQRMLPVLDLQAMAARFQQEALTA
jgi:purine-binding chemotaxis protein CheW